MFVSKQLKEKNIAEYLIYMWQIEDLIRANGCDIEKIKSTIIAPYPLTEEQKEEPELETCFEALYGILLLKLQKKEISEETRKAQEAISTLLAMLSNYYIEDKKGELEF